MDLDAVRHGTLEFDLEGKGASVFVIRVLLLIVIRILAGFSGGLAFFSCFIFFAKLVRNKLNLYTFFCLLIIEFDLFHNGREVIKFFRLLVDFFHHVGLDVARNDTGGAIFSDELDVRVLVHLSNLNLALCECDGAGRIFILDSDAGHSVVTFEALAVFGADFNSEIHVGVVLWVIDDLHFNDVFVCVFIQTDHFVDSLVLDAGYSRAIDGANLSNEVFRNLLGDFDLKVACAL